MDFLIVVGIALVSVALGWLIGDADGRRAFGLRWRARFVAWRERRVLRRITQRVEDANAAMAVMQPGDPRAEQKAMEAVLARGTEDVLRVARASGVQMSAAEAEAHARELMADAGWN